MTLHITSYNPSENYHVIGKVNTTSDQDLENIIKKARTAFDVWKKTPIISRVQFLRGVYDIFDKKREIVAMSIAKEMGMPIRQARDEVQYGMTYFDWYLENAIRILSPEITHESETEIHTVYYEPK